MSKCPNCCPDGGAIFRMGFGWGGRDYLSDPELWAMTCNNCGYQRKPRAPSKKAQLHTYSFVTEQAESDEGMTTANAMRFHCFNPNGAYAKLRAMHEKITQWTYDHPERPNGVLFVYGSLNDHPRKILFDVLDLHRKGKAHKWPLRYALQNIEKEIARGEEFLADDTKWPAVKTID